MIALKPDKMFPNFFFNFFIDSIYLILTSFSISVQSVPFIVGDSFAAIGQIDSDELFELSVQSDRIAVKHEKFDEVGAELGISVEMG